MSFKRELIRKQLKELKKNNDISKEWARYQLNQSSPQAILDMKRKNRRRK